MNRRVQKSRINGVRRHTKLRSGRIVRRRGAATLDYVLVLGVILPMATFLMMVVPRMIKLVYELVVVNVGSPLM
jgi:hypothetical protein